MYLGQTEKNSRSSSYFPTTKPLSPPPSPTYIDTVAYDDGLSLVGNDTNGHVYTATVEDDIAQPPEEKEKPCSSMNGNDVPVAAEIEIFTPDNIDSLSDDEWREQLSVGQMVDMLDDEKNLWREAFIFEKKKSSRVVVQPRGFSRSCMITVPCSSSKLAKPYTKARNWRGQLRVETKVEVHSDLFETSSGAKRPIFQMEGKDQPFLFFIEDHNEWWIGDTVGQRYGYMNVESKALHPCDITETWEIFDDTDKKWEKDKSIRCVHIDNADDEEIETVGEHRPPIRSPRLESAKRPRVEKDFCKMDVEETKIENVDLLGNLLSGDTNGNDNHYDNDDGKDSIENEKGNDIFATDSDTDPDTADLLAGLNNMPSTVSSSCSYTNMSPSPSKVKENNKSKINLIGKMACQISKFGTYVLKPQMYVNEWKWGTVKRVNHQKKTIEISIDNNRGYYSFQSQTLHNISLQSDKICEPGTHMRLRGKSRTFGQNVAVNDTKNADPRGVVGLRNLGNTCFMNSMLQCLNAVPNFREYFVGSSPRYKSEINTVNVLGTGGQVATAFALMLQDIWSGEFQVVSPSHFKETLSRFAPRFAGYQQHCSAELFLYLLDNLHEDLNRVKKKPYVECVDDDGRSDAELANEAWKRHKMRNDSFIVDMFKAQYRSHLTCPNESCRGLSWRKYDPYMSLALPLVQKKTIDINVLLVQRQTGSETFLCPIRYVVTVKKAGCGRDIAEALSKILSQPDSLCHPIDTDDLVITEISFKKVYKMYFSVSMSINDSIARIGEQDTIVAYESYSKEVGQNKVREEEEEEEEKNGEGDGESKDSFLSDEFLQDIKETNNSSSSIQICRLKIGQFQQKERFNLYNHYNQFSFEAYPLMLSFPVGAKYSDLHDRVWDEVSPMLRSLTSVEDTSGRNDDDSLNEVENKSDDYLNETDEEDAASPQMTSIIESLHPDSSQLKIPPPPPLLDEDDEESSAENSTVKSDENCNIRTIHFGARDNPETNVYCPYRLFLTSNYGDIERANMYSSYQYNSKRESLNYMGFCLLPDSQDQVEASLHGVGVIFKKKYRDTLKKEKVFPEDSRIFPAHKDVLAQKNGNGSGGREVLELATCLRKFMSREQLDEQNTFYCPNCKQHVRAFKTVSIWSLNDTFVLHLKRFSFEQTQWSVHSEKVTTKVNFPFVLDAREFVMGPQKDDERECIYELFAVSNHIGGYGGGHYTAFVKHENEWFECDDSSVRKIDESEVVTDMAYVLFYRRRVEEEASMEAKKHLSKANELGQ